jgi:hypothetical protein
MNEILLPIAYFLILFGFFEVGIFKKRRAYWHRPYLTIGYFSFATVGALVLFSTKPLQLVLESGFFALTAVVVLYIALFYLAWRGHFCFSETTKTIVDRRRESLRYVFGKSTDIMFQDVMSVIIFFALLEFSQDVFVAAAWFASYTLLSHTLLFLILPARFATIFVLASVGASLAFSAILAGAVGVIYLFVLHWIFYALAYGYIRKIRTEFLS